ncbi:hypothetical protein V8F20_007684 [Naviculisporaceae sp. PSN 640]
MMTGSVHSSSLFTLHLFILLCFYVVSPPAELGLWWVGRRRADARPFVHAWRLGRDGERLGMPCLVFLTNRSIVGNGTGWMRDGTAHCGAGQRGAGNTRRPVHKRNAASNDGFSSRNLGKSFQPAIPNGPPRLLRAVPSFRRCLQGDMGHVHRPGTGIYMQGAYGTGLYTSHLYKCMGRPVGIGMALDLGYRYIPRVNKIGMVDNILAYTVVFCLFFSSLLCHFFLSVHVV